MNYILDIFLALFFVWVLKELGKQNKYIKILSAFMLILILALIPVYTSLGDGFKFVIDYVVFVVAGILIFVMYKRVIPIVQKAEDKMAALSDNNKAEKSVLNDEEDFMKTKQGKLVMAICILLVIYMIGSAVCIYKLNQKINSVYTITQEIQDNLGN